MDEGEFCVVCGATGRALVGGVCAECAADRTVLLSAPAHGRVTVCPHCGARERSGRFERAGTGRILTAEDLAPLLVVHPEVGVRRLRWEEVDATANAHRLVGRAHVVFRGVARDVEVPLTVHVDFRACPDCSRRSGRFHTAILQLRGEGGRSSEKAPALRARLDELWSGLLREARPDWRKAFSWREALPEGWDCFFTDTLAARAVTRLAKTKFGASVKESAKLVGRQNGQDVRRVTFCLRFPKPLGTTSVGSAPSSVRREKVEQ